MKKVEKKKVAIILVARARGFVGDDSDPARGSIYDSDKLQSVKIHVLYLIMEYPHASIKK